MSQSNFHTMWILYLSRSGAEGKPICDVIKQNESELANTDFKIYPNKTDNFFVSYCFATHGPHNPAGSVQYSCRWTLQLPTFFRSNWPISVGLVVNSSFANDAFIQSEKLKLNQLQIHFAWLHPGVVLSLSPASIWTEAESVLVIMHCVIIIILTYLPIYLIRNVYIK